MTAPQAQQNDEPRRKRVYSPPLATPAGRLCFGYLAAPDQEGPYADNKYKVVLAIPKDGDGVAAFLAALQRFAAQHLPTADGHLTPVRDGADRAQPDPAHWYLTAKSRRQPPVVDGRKQPLAPDAVTRGSLVRLSVLASPFSLAQTVVERGRALRREVHGLTLYLAAVQVLELAAAAAPRDPLAALDDVPF